MQAAVVEVVARIADSVVDLAHVEHDGHYRIGTDAEVELPIAAGKLRSFPILDAGFLVRRPAGFTATLHIGGISRPLVETELRLEPGWRVELALGTVVVELAIIERRIVLVPRPRFEVRPWIYGACVLFAHLMV